MKIQSIRRRQGVTLLEMTIVIMIIIALISVLFIGFKMYRDGANKANCLILMSSAQKEARAHQALNNGLDGKDFKEAPSATVMTTIFKATQNPCPSGGGNYSSTGKYPKTTNGVEAPVLTCGGTDAVSHNKAFKESLGEPVAKD